MRIVKLPGGSIVIRESPKELPINRYTDHQKYLMMDAGIGSKMAHFIQHLGTLDSLMAAGNYEDAHRERENLQINIFAALNRISFRNLSVVCLVEAIDDVVLKDYSEDNLLKVSDQLGEMGLTDVMIDDILSAVKKNSILI